MSEKKAYICPNCKTVYFSEEKESLECSSCKKELVDTNFTENDWKTLSVVKKDAIKAKIESEHEEKQKAKESNRVDIRIDDVSREYYALVEKKLERMDHDLHRIYGHIEFIHHVLMFFLIVILLKLAAEVYVAYSIVSEIIQ